MLLDFKNKVGLKGADMKEIKTGHCVSEQLRFHWARYQTKFLALFFARLLLRPLLGEKIADTGLLCLSIEIRMYLE